MLISDCAALTLLDSSIPEVTETVSSVLALPPLFKRSNPSSPFCRLASGGLTSLMRSTCVTANGAEPCGTTDTVPSLPMLTTVEGGITGGRDRAHRRNPQIAGARIGFLAVGAANRNESRAVHGDIEIAARALHGAGGTIRAGISGHGVDARGVTRAVDRLAVERHGVGAKADGAEVGDVVVVHGLRLHDLLRARHGHIEFFFHG